MSPEALQRFKELLATMLADLESGATVTVDGMRKEATPFPDPTDRATLESDRNLLLRIRDRERKLKSKIEEALLRLDDGTFGVCEVCEESISFKRLEARPVTTLCINCKEEQEQDEEKHGA